VLGIAGSIGVATRIELVAAFPDREEVPLVDILELKY
jgi:hypothetical protein